MIDETFDYAEYLAIKQAIDDQSLNHDVWQHVSSWLKTQSDEQDISILEIGAGTGSMIIRLLNAGLLGNCRYFAVELEPGFDRVAEKTLSLWSRSHGYTMETTDESRWIMKNEEHKVEIQWLAKDILELTEYFEPASFDMLLGHAVVDLLPVPECMPGLLNLLNPGGSYYFSLNFAGETAFSPSHPRDEMITTAYHQDMDSRFPGIEWQPSCTGKQLGRWLVRQGHKVEAEGDSHWQLSTAPSSSAPQNRFIGNILDTMEKALAGREGLKEWINLRRQQVDAGELLFFAANRDIFGHTGISQLDQGKESDNKDNDIP